MSNFEIEVCEDHLCSKFPPCTDTSCLMLHVCQGLWCRVCPNCGSPRCTIEKDVDDATLPQ